MRKTLKSTRPAGIRLPITIKLYWFLVFFIAIYLQMPVSVQAQEALQNSIAGQNASVSRTKALQNPDYTIKYGDFRLLITPSSSFSWNDNVNLSETNKISDYILSPSVGVRASYPFSEYNVLFLDINVGYDRYLDHPNLSSFQLNSTSGTGLSFDIGIEDVNINIHDWMHYSQDGAQNGTIANTANYGTFDNTAGLAVDWHLNKATLSAGYDHENVLSTSAEFDSINHSSELLFVRPSLQINPKVRVGAESTATFTTYSQDTLNNNDAYTLGLFTDLNPGKAVAISARGGFTTYQFQQSSTSVATSDQNSWYAGLTLSHQPFDHVSYSIDAGRQVQLGTQSDLTENWYVRPNITWNIIKDWDLGTGFFYEHGKQGVGNITGNLNETYDWYGGSLNLQHQLSQSFSVGLNYRLTFRSSDIPNNGYTQNVIGLQLTYHPK